MKKNTRVKYREIKTVKPYLLRMSTEELMELTKKEVNFNKLELDPSCFQKSKKAKSQLKRAKKNHKQTGNYNSRPVTITSNKLV